MRLFSAFLFASVVCLLAQSAPQTHKLEILGPDGKPLPADKQPTMTLEQEDPRGTGPDLAGVPEDKVLVTIGDEKITAGMLRAIIDGLPAQARETARGARRRQLAEEIVKIKLLAVEARRKKVDQVPAVQAQITFQRDNLLASTYFQQMSNAIKIEEEAARAWYKQHISEWERVRARHILVRMKGSQVPLRPDQKDLSEEEALAKAQALRKKLAEGADFAALAAAESDDTGSGAKGGDLGFFRRGQMAPSFEYAAWPLAIGQISEPVKTPYGYHIIRMEAREAKPFEDVRAEVEKRMRPELAQKALEQLRKEAAVTLDAEFFGK